MIEERCIFIRKVVFLGLQASSQRVGDVGIPQTLL